MGKNMRAWLLLFGNTYLTTYLCILNSGLGFGGMLRGIVPKVKAPVGVPLP